MNLTWPRLTSTPIPVVIAKKNEILKKKKNTTKDCFSDSAEAVLCQDVCVSINICHFVHKFAHCWIWVGEGRLQRGGNEQEGVEKVAHAILYWPVLEVEWQATPCRAPPCSPSLWGVVWSTPMGRWFLWPASEHMATGWEDEGGQCEGSVTSRPKFCLLHLSWTTPHPNTLPPCAVWATLGVNLNITTKGRTDVGLTNSIRA